MAIIFKQENKEEVDRLIRTPEGILHVPEGREIGVVNWKPEVQVNDFVYVTVTGRLSFADPRPPPRSQNCTNKVHYSGLDFDKEGGKWKCFVQEGYVNTAEVTFPYCPDCGYNLEKENDMLKE